MLNKFNYDICPLGDSAVIVQFDRVISLEINQLVQSLAKSLSNNPFCGMVEIIPAYCTLTIMYDIAEISDNTNLTCAYDIVKNILMDRLKNLSDVSNIISKSIEIPICYDKKYALDLQDVADKNNMSTSEVIKIHSSTIYHVYMTGFAPGFAFLGGLSDAIATPRRDNPRLEIPAGAVGIGGNQTGIYPIVSPGGWNIIGQCPLKLYDLNQTRINLINTGDKVAFTSISCKDFDLIKESQV